MNHRKYKKELGATVAYTKRMMESTKGICQKYKKGATKDCFISHQIRRRNMRWKLVPSLLVW